MLPSAQGLLALPNRVVFPPSPPSDSEPPTSPVHNRQREELLLHHGSSENGATRPTRDAPRQRPMLCPYFLKNPHLVPEHSPCRLKSFENVQALREHIEYDHNIQLQSELLGETELEKFQHIWMQIFTKHRGSIPHPCLCDREFLRKQQNFRVMEMHEAYILLQLGGQPAVAATLKRIFDDFRDRFSPNRFGYFFLPESIHSLPNTCSVSASTEGGPDESDPNMETKSTSTTLGSQTIETLDALSDVSESSGSFQTPSDPAESFLVSTTAKVVDKVMEEFEASAERDVWGSSEDDESEYSTDDSSTTDGNQDEAIDAGEGTSQSTNGPSQSSNGPSRLNTPRSAAESSNTGGNRKRKSTGSGSQKNNDGGGGKRRRSVSPDDSETTSNEKRFSCPYYKRDPVRRRDEVSCSKPPGFKTVNRVKEHIYRVHGPRNECPRCRGEFKNPDILQTHLASEDRCILVTNEGRPEKESINHEKESKLKSKRDLRGVAPKEQWRKVYRVVFDLPEDCETPDPYYDEKSTWYLQKYNSFRDRRLPQLVREELERQGRLHLSEIFASVMRTCHDRVFSEFQENQTSGALQGEDASNETIQREQSSANAVVQQQPNDQHTAPQEQWVDEVAHMHDNGPESQLLGSEEWPNVDEFDSYLVNLGASSGFPPQGDWA